MGLDIAILVGFPSPGGIHSYCREFIPRLTERGHRVRLICYESQPPFPDLCEVIELRPPMKSVPLLWRFADYARYRHLIRSFQRLEQPRPDLTICMNELSFEGHRRRWSDVPVVYLSHALVAPLEVESYGLTGTRRMVARWVYSLAQRQCLNLADRSVRFTQFGCRALTEYYGSAVRPRFALNPMPVAFPADVAARSHREGPVKLLFVSRLIPTKNLSFVLDVLGQLRDRRWELDVVGDGLERAELEARAARLGLTGRVRFCGHQADPSPWYRQADLLVFPSRLDYCPTVILEAASYGVPAIVIKSDGVRYRNGGEDLIDPGKTGFVSSDEARFRSDLEAVLGDPSPLAGLGAAARERVRTEHIWDRHLDRYESLFAELLGRRARV